MTPLRAGAQLHLSVMRDVNLRDLLEMAKLAVAGGISQLWLTDNLNNRNTFAVLGSLAASVPVDLGTAVLVQYFHNPVQIAGAAATVNEIMDGRELSLGIARGNESTERLVRTPKPVTFLRETAESVSRLLAGESVTFDAYPTLASYFHIQPATPFRLSFPPPKSVHLYCGGNGPLSLAVGGECMDGLIFGGTFQAVGLMSQLPSLLSTFDAAGEKAGRAGQQHKVAEIKLSVARDGKAARNFAAISSASRLLSLRNRGFSDEHIEASGACKKDLDRFAQARAAGVSRGELLELVTDEMIDAIFVAGDPQFCRERIAAIAKLATDHGFEQLMFSEFGPDPREGLQLLCDELLPVL